MDPGKVSRLLIDQPSDFLARFLPRDGPNETYESELPAFSELLEVSSPAKADWDEEYELEYPETNAPIPLEEQPIAQPNKTFEELLEEQLSIQEQAEAVVVPVKRKEFLKRKEGGLSSANKKPKAKTKPGEKKQTERKSTPIDRPIERRQTVPAVEKLVERKPAERPAEKKAPVVDKPTRGATVRVKTAPPKPQKQKTPEKPKEPKKSAEKHETAMRRQWSPEKPVEIEYDRDALEDVESEMNAHFQNRLSELEENLLDFRGRNKLLTQKIKEYSQTYQELEQSVEVIQQQKVICRQRSVKAQFETALETELKKRKAEFAEQLKAKEQSLSERKDPEALNELRMALARLGEEARLVDAKNKLEIRELQMELQEEGKELEELEGELREYAKDRVKGGHRGAR
jgi:hypothetical protein